MSSPLLIVGAGGHGRVVADAALAAGRSVLAFIDEQPRMEHWCHVPVKRLAVDDIPKLARELGAEILVAVGANVARRRLQTQLAAAGVRLGVVQHPSSIVAASAALGAGAVVLAGAVVGVDARIGDGAIINTGAQVDHDGNIGQFCHLSPGVTLGGTVAVGEGTHLAVGVNVRNGISIGAWSMVGVGAAVVTDLAAGVLAWGVPARVVRAWEAV